MPRTSAWLILRDEFPDERDAKLRRRATLAAALLALAGSLASAALELSRSETGAFFHAMALAVGFAVATSLARRTETRHLGAHLLTGLLAMNGATSVVLYSGAHPSLVVAGVVPIVAILVCGFVAGSLWSLALCSVLIAGALGAFGTITDPDLTRVRGAAILAMASFGLACAYEQLRLRARRDAKLARAEAAESQLDLERSHARFRALVERTFDGFTILGPEGSLEYINPAMSAATGYAADAIDGITVSDCTTRFAHPDDTIALQETYLRCREQPGRVVSVEARYQHQELGYQYYELTAKNLIDDPAVGGIVVNYRDLGDRRRAEEGRRRLDERLEQARQLESLAGLAGGVAHDFNNLLTVVKGNVSLLRSGATEESGQAPILDEVDEAVERAAELTDRMLLFSGAKASRPELLDLQEFVPGEAERLASTAPESVRVQVIAPTRALVMADGERVAELLRELFENACEAIGDGPGRVEISTGEMEADRAYLAECQSSVIALPEGRWAYVEVEDSGPGIAPGDLPRIFDPFFTSKEAGRGLGLSAVLGIARSCGAAIHLDSAADRGTAVRVLFPPAISPAGSSGRPDEGSARLVLIVDDQLSVRSVATRLLEDLGMEVRSASGGRQALEELASRPGEWGLVLLDLTMPDITGVELLPEIRRIEPDVPVVLMSGYRGADVEAADEQVRFLQKPFGRDRLASLLELVGLRDPDSGSSQS